MLLILLIPTTALHAQRINRSNYELLWRIDGPGMPSPSYLFGTMHLADKRVFDFSDSVLVALRNTSSFATEVDMDSIMSYIFSPDGIMSDTVNYMRRILTAKEYRYVDSMVIRKTGGPIDHLQMKRLWILEALLLDEEEALSKRAGRNLKAENIFLDGWLHQKAILLGKPIHSLEKMQNQLHLLGTETSKMQKEAFLENLGYYELENDEKTQPGTIFKERISVLDSLVNLYYEANLQSIATLIKDYDSIDDGPGLSVRNVEMAGNLAVLANKSSVFAAVGAAHLPGEKGIISLLRAKGFTVTPVQATFTGQAKKDRQQLDSIQGYLLNKIAEGYSVALPGMPITYPIPNSNRKMYVGNSEAQTGFAFCLDVPQMGTDNQQMANAIINNMAGRGNATLQKSYPVTHRGVDGMEATMLQNDIPFYIRVFIRNHRTFVFMYGATDEDSVGRKEFFKSVRFYDIVRPVLTYDTLSRPQLGFSAILPSDINHVNNSLTIRPVEAYSGIDDVNGISYMLRIDKMKGGYFNNSDETLLAGVRLTLLKEDSTLQLIDSTVSERNGLPLYQLRFRHTNGFISRLHFIPRGNLAYALLTVYDSTRADSLYWQRFLNGFQIHPLQAQAPVVRFTPADSSFTIAGPTTFDAIIRRGQDASSEVQTYSYAAVDTMSYATYTAEVYKYNRYYCNEPDSLVNDFIHPADSIFSIVSQQKTMWEGQPVYTTELKLRHTGLRCYRKALVAGHTIYRLSAILPEEIISKGYGAQFLTAFEPGNGSKADTLRLTQKKLPVLLKDLQSKDASVFRNASDYFQNIAPDSTDKELIINALNMSFPADTAGENVKSQLLLSLGPIADNAVVHAAERLFSETTDASQRIGIIYFLSGLPMDSAIRTVLRLAPEIPEDNTDDIMIFSSYLLHNSLYLQYMPAMIATAEKSRSFLQFFAGYTYRDSIWLSPHITQYGLNRLIPRLSQLFEYQFKKRSDTKEDRLPVWEYRLLTTGRILALPNMPAAAETIFKQLLTDTIMSLRALGARGLIGHGLSVDDKILQSILADKEEGYAFITALDENRQLSSIRHLLSQELIGHCYLSNYLAEGYAREAINIEEVTRVRVQHEKLPAQWLILYRVKIGESRNWKYILNGPQPLSSKEFNINPRLIHYIRDESKWKDKKQLAKEAAEAYESFLRAPEGSDEDDDYVEIDEGY
ncbi:TraB/GumN family protein [Chitinophaga filiformis]|uniref:TraB/GumN family protein n=1 Tax=Chitinophaga filiformis TaxID=104663 RepID=A0ABY4IA50_CHIFI|nr:TraB/GumN family protein [Chitinophaga filiformis]UPK71551.1 TraB/GumN family protein [Chitinophaga filiformis]